MGIPGHGSVDLAPSRRPLYSKKNIHVVVVVVVVDFVVFFKESV